VDVEVCWIDTEREKIRIDDEWDEVLDNSDIEWELLELELRDMGEVLMLVELLDTWLVIEAAPTPNAIVVTRYRIMQNTCIVNVASHNYQGSNFSIGVYRSLRTYLGTLRNKSHIFMRLEERGRQAWQTIVRHHKFDA
jgi:hypothetical protein